jgi:hypothetical protein
MKKDSAPLLQTVLFIADFPATRKGCQGQPEKAAVAERRAAAKEGNFRGSKK